MSGSIHGNFRQLTNLPSATADSDAQVGLGILPIAIGIIYQALLIRPPLIHGSLCASGKKLAVDKWTVNNQRIMRAFLTFIIICLTLDFTASGQTNKKSILGIFPHPDDENMIGPVLAKYSRLGHNVYIIIARDGKPAANSMYKKCPAAANAISDN
jgi:hypothetical protein